MASSVSAKQKMLELADMIREADGDIQALDWGSIVRDWGNEYDDVKSWFEPWQKDSVTNFEAMQDAADEFGLSYNSLVQGMAGNTSEGRKAIEELNAAIEEQEKVVDGLTTQGVAYNSAQGQANAKEIERLNSLKALKGGLEEATGRPPPPRPVPGVQRCRSRCPPQQQHRPRRLAVQDH